MATVDIRVPDIGNAKDVTVIEVLVAPGDSVEFNQSLITVEGDKASMEIPATATGTVEKLHVKVGDKVSEGDLIVSLKGTAAQATPTPAEKSKEAKVEVKPDNKEFSSTRPETQNATTSTASTSTTMAAGNKDNHLYASPIVRRLARELNIELASIRGTGSKGRIQKSDLIALVKQRMQGGGNVGGNLNIILPISVDFSKFGAIEIQPMNKIKRSTGLNLHRNWVTIPHVTQFDEADITEMEAFRQEQAKQNIKLTPLVFVMKAVVAALREYPLFNASLDETGEQLILKKYFHLGIAVDTPNGLVVPVIRNVDQKGLFDLAKELAEISAKAREKGLTPADMSGSCFTISSLGGIGGTAFTPIINSPDVAILGVSRAYMKPVYIEGDFEPRLTLPLSLSYDHRVIDGADGARFCRFVAEQLSDIRRLLL